MQRSEVQKYSHFIPCSYFEKCAYTYQHEFSGALHMFSWLFHDKAYFSKRLQPIHQLYRILRDERVGRSFCAPALALQRAQTLHFQTQSQSVFAILLNVLSWGVSLVTVLSLWISDELNLMVRIQDTNLVVLCKDLSCWVNM